MEKLPLCRICLVKNVRMYVVVNKNLQELYEKLTDVPFVTEDSRPMLACFFCCTKLKQCYRFLRKCLEAEDLFAQMMNEDCETDPVINSEQLQFYNGFSNCQIEHISIDHGGQTESEAIKEGLPAVFVRLDEIIVPKEEHQTDELDLKNVENSYSDVKATLSHHSESDSEDIPLMEIKTEVRDTQESVELDLNNVDNSYSDVKDTSAQYTESDSEDVPLMEIKTEVEDEQESIGAPAVKKPKLVPQKEDMEKSVSLKHKNNGQEHSENTDNSKNSYVKSINKTEKAISSRTAIKGAPAVKKPKLVPQKEDMEKSVSLKHKNNGQEHSENTENSKNSYVKSINKTEKAISSRTAIKGKHRVTNDTICNNKGAIGTKRIENTALSQCDKINKDEFKCKICNYKGFNSIDIVRHSLRHNNVCAKDRPYTCDVCQSSFQRSDHLKTHIRTHTGEKPYKCDICQISFIRKGDLNTHIRIHTGEKPYKCDICQISFIQKGNLKTHIRTHTGEKPYKCNSCHSSFNCKGNLKTHIRTHTGEKPYKCDICQSSFNKKCDLNDHIRTHTGEKPYKCNFCHSSFKYERNLKTHIRIHTGEKPYKCDICQISFIQKGNLKTHILTHTGEKPYKCNSCHSSFNCKGNLKTHIRTHTGEKPYKCNSCHSSFNCKGNLKTHIRTHTGEKPYNCDICQRSFNVKGNLNNHIRTHTGEKPNKCDI